MGSVIKTVTFYEKAFWREKGFNGVLISDCSPAYVTVDDTKPDGSYPAIMRLVIISVLFLQIVECRLAFRPFESVWNVNRSSGLLSMA